MTIKLAPNGTKMEVRVKGPTVTTGYHGDPEKTAAAFDEEGFYKLGDAAKFVDDNDPSQGMIFDGRVTEDFKLDSGTWVSVGTLRPDLVAACSPYVMDGVIAGQDKPFIGALFWPSMAGMQALAADNGPGSPIVFGSAPIAFGMLAEAMERDPVLRASFFKNLRYMGYGGATLSNDVNDRLQALAVAETGFRIPLTTMYGATETQGVTVTHWATEKVGLVGLPVPGVTIKLVPNGTKMEVRVKGPTVTSGYHGDPEKTAAAFDEEGFYRLGDAARFVDDNDPSQGMVFDGRVTEDFKLDSGTWVSVGTLRPDLVAAASPYVMDAVIAGQDRPFIAALVWPSMAGMQALPADAGPGSPIDKLAAILKEKLAAFNASAGGSSRRIGRFVIMTEPPSIDGGEITDKGYVNQRATLDRRDALVKALYATPAGDGVITVQD